MTQEKETFASKKGKGRPKGSVNKVSIQLRIALEEHGFDIAEKLIELYNSPQCELKDQIRIIFRILEYTNPRIKELDLAETSGGDGESPKPVAVALQDLIKIARGDKIG